MAEANDDMGKRELEDALVEDSRKPFRLLGRASIDGQWEEGNMGWEFL